MCITSSDQAHQFPDLVGRFHDPDLMPVHDDRVVIERHNVPDIDYHLSARRVSDNQAVIVHRGVRSLQHQESFELQMLQSTSFGVRSADTRTQTNVPFETRSDILRSFMQLVKRHASGRIYIQSQFAHKSSCIRFSVTLLFDFYYWSEIF